MPKRPKRKQSARQRRDAELAALLRELVGTLRDLNVTAARLEQRIERATERFAAMRRG